VTALQLTCSDLTELVTEYLERALPRAEELSFETHLVYCAECRTFFIQIRQVVQGLNELPPEPGDQADRARLVDAYRGRS
jgi:hypothetical protein